MNNDILRIKEDIYFLKMFFSTEYSYVIFDDTLYYLPDKDACIVRETECGVILIDPSNTAIPVANCFPCFHAILPHLKTGNTQIFTVYASFLPCKIGKYLDEYIARGIFDITIKNDKISLPQIQITNFVRNYGFSVWYPNHFANAIKYFLNKKRRTYDLNKNYYFTSYDYKDKDDPSKNYASFISPYIKNDFLPLFPKGSTNNYKMQECIDNISKFLDSNPSSGMILLYSLFAITYKFIMRYYYDGKKPLNTFPTLSLNYFGENKKTVMQNVNLFANFFDAFNWNYMPVKYNITLDSVRYSLDNYTAFGDIPLIVTKSRSKITSMSKKLSEIISLRYYNYIYFFPVIISEHKLKFAEIISIECTENKSLSLYNYRKLKNCINTFYKKLILFINHKRDIFEDVPYIITDTDLYSCMHSSQYTDGIMSILFQKTIDIISLVLSKMVCDYTYLYKQLIKILDLYMEDKNLKSEPPAVENLQGPMSNTKIQKLLDFVKLIYEEHKSDSPQKTVWIEEFYHPNDQAFFSTTSYDTRIIYINNRIVEDFIKDKLKYNTKSMKKELFEAGIIRKADRRYTFKKHDKGEHICLCFFAEFLELGDKNEHLSDKQSND